MMKRVAVVLAVTVMLSACVKSPGPEEFSVSSEPAEIQTTVPSETFLPETVPAVTESVTEIVTEAATEPDASDFVRVADYLPHVRVELAYATTDNFTGTIIYGFTDAYLRYGTVLKLMKADDILSEQGYGLVIWDAYRPIYAQEKLWEVWPDPAYVSPPGTGIQSHCRGLAVDVTLYDLETGELLEMPTGLDSFTSQADRDYSDCTASAAANALLLEQTLESCGLKPYRAEWWHFSDTDNYEIEYIFDPVNPDIP